MWREIQHPEEAIVSTATAMKASETRPTKLEFLPYYERYIALVPDGDVISALASQLSETQSLLRVLPASVATYRYAPDKWSVNEVVGHMIDSERIFAGRALRFARNDATPIPGFEQDDYVRNATFDAYPLSDLAAELETVRQSTIFFFRHLDEEAWTRRGLANNAEVSVRALAYIIAGHELHHREILKTRYL
jgi:DinB superfamily